MKSILTGTETLHIMEHLEAKISQNMIKKEQLMFVIIIFINQKSMLNLHYVGQKINSIKNLIEEKYIQYYRNIIEKIIILIFDHYS